MAPLLRLSGFPVAQAGFRYVLNGPCTTQPHPSQLIRIALISLRCSRINLAIRVCHVRAQPLRSCQTVLGAGWTCPQTPSTEDSWTSPRISVSSTDVAATIHLYPDEPRTKTTQTCDGAVGKSQPQECCTPVLHVSKNLTIDDGSTTSIGPFAAVTQHLSPAENTMSP